MMAVVKDTMTLWLVSLFSSLLLTSVCQGQFPNTQGQFPNMQGQFPNMQGLGFPFGNNFNQFGGANGGFGGQQQGNNLLTCINADLDDPQSQIRLTFRPLQQDFFGLNSMNGQINPDQPQDWTVDGILLPSKVEQKSGTYQVGVFQGGRTFDGCKMNALGQVLDNGSQNPFNPFFNGGNFGGASGIISNPAIVSTGTTSFSGMLRGMTFNDLNGRAVGVCGAIQNGQCNGAIPYCCSLTRDTIAASEVFVDSNSQSLALGFNPPGNFIGGQVAGNGNQGNGGNNNFVGGGGLF